MDYQQRLADILKNYQNQGFTDPWGAAYAQRFNPEIPGFVGKHDEPLKNAEHYLYARDTASLGPQGFAQMVVGTPGHMALKALGVKKGEPSLEELYRGWQGAAHGLGDWAKEKYRGSGLSRAWQQMKAGQR